MIFINILTKKTIKMSINIFDLSKDRACAWSRPAPPVCWPIYAKRHSSFAYDAKEWKKLMIDFGKKFNFPIEEIPWGENIRSDKSKKFTSKVIEFFTEEELSSVPIHLKYNYYSDNTMTTHIVNFCWNEFVKHVNNIRKICEVRGESDSFQSFLSFSYQDFNSKLMPIMPEFGFTTNPIFNIKKIYDSFKSGNKFPIFMDTVFDKKYKTLSLMPSVSFCEVLINYKYFFNSPMDVIFGGQGIEEHNIGNVEVPTIETLSKHILKNLNSNLKDSTVNIFIDRSDLLTWMAGTTTFDECSYYVRDIKVFEKKDNYYEDLLKEITLFKKIFKTIINFKTDTEELNLEDCKILLDELVELE